MARTREDMLAELKANPKVQAHRRRRRHQRHQRVPRAGAAGDARAARRSRRLLRRLQLGAFAHDPRRPALSRERRDRPRARVAARARRAPAQRAALRPSAADDGADPARLQRAPQRRLRRARGCAASRPSAGRSRSRPGSPSTTACRASAAPCRATSSAAATRPLRSGPTCRRRCASRPPTTTPGSAIPSGSASSWSLDGARRRTPDGARDQPSRRHATATATGSSLADALTGEEFAVTADVIVNATGAWVDETNAALAGRRRAAGAARRRHQGLASDPRQPGAARAP